MLTNYRTRVDRYHLSVGECLLYALYRPLVVGRLSVGGHQHGTIYNKVVSVGCRQLRSILVVDRVGERHPQQSAVGQYSCYGVNVTVSIVARQRLVVEPHYAVGT